MQEEQKLGEGEGGGSAAWEWAWGQLGEAWN